MAAVPSTKKDRSPIPNLAALDAASHEKLTTTTTITTPYDASIARGRKGAVAFCFICFARVELAARDVAIRHRLASPSSRSPIPYPRNSAPRAVRKTILYSVSQHPAHIYTLTPAAFVSVLSRLSLFILRGHSTDGILSRPQFRPRSSSS